MPYSATDIPTTEVAARRPVLVPTTKVAALRSKVSCGDWRTGTRRRVTTSMDNPIESPQETLLRRAATLVVGTKTGRRAATAGR
jgi:hypothetical protein